MLAKLKMVLGITGTDKDEQLNFIIELVTEEILNYCHLAQLPAQLNNVAIMMCADVYRQSLVGQEKLKSEIKSTSRGDTSYSFKTPSELALEAVKSPSFMTNYQKQVMKFRKMRR